MIRDSDCPATATGDERLGNLVGIPAWCSSGGALLQPAALSAGPPLPRDLRCRAHAGRST
jgi:hypothetical protein